MPIRIRQGQIGDRNPMHTISRRFLSILILGGFLFSGAPAGAENAVIISDTAIQPGESFVLDVYIQTDEFLAGWNLTFRWSSPDIRCDSAVVDSSEFDSDFAAGTPPIDYENFLVPIALVPTSFTPPPPEIAPGTYRAARLYFTTLPEADDQFAFVDSAVVMQAGAPQLSTFSLWSGRSIFPTFDPGIITIGNPAAVEIVAAMDDPLLEGALDGLDPTAGLSITTTGVDVDWSATWQSTWLHVAPSLGKTPAFATVSADLFGLDIGNYFDTIHITSPRAVNSPVFVPVQLRIDSVPPPPAPLGFDLMPPRPNPFVTYSDPETEINYSLDDPDFVAIRIYDTLGRRIRTLVSRENVPAGDHLVRWDGHDDNGRLVASGRYFYRMTTSTGAITRRIIVIK